MTSPLTSYPRELALPIASIPPSSQQWLLDKRGEGVGVRRGRTGNLIVFLIALTCFASAFAEPKVARGALILGALLVTKVARSIVARQRSRFGSFVVLHPLYLLVVDVDWLRAFPLWKVTAGEVIHHTYKGFYQQSCLSFTSDGTPVSLFMLGKDASERLTREALTRAKDAENQLTAHSGFIPPELAQKDRPSSTGETLRSLAYQLGPYLLAGLAAWALSLMPVFRTGWLPR
jgi:hypothetical protein